MPQWRKLKLTVMMRRELAAVREVFESLKTYAAKSEESALSGLGMDSAPNSVFQTLRASPKFKIIEFYG